LMRLYAEDADRDMFFGGAVAVHEGRVVVGAPGPTYYPAGVATIDDGGAAYIFDLATGEQLAKLQPRDSSFGPLLSCYNFGQTVALADGVVLVGAPKAKYPCAPSTKTGAAFSYTVPSDGLGLRARETPWWWGQGATYNQTGHFVPPEAFGVPPQESQIEFGHSLAITHTVWARDTPLQSVFVIGAPGARDDQGAVYFVGPFDHLSPFHTGTGTMQRVLGPAYLQQGARYGHSLAVDRESGLALIGAPGGFTARGNTGAVLRTWIVRDTFAPQSVASTVSNVSSVSAPVSLNASALTPPAAPPPPPMLPLQDIVDRIITAPDGEPNDYFGTAVALGKRGHSICGATSAMAFNTSNNATVAMLQAGAAYSYAPVIDAPSSPPTAPPPPSPPPLPPSPGPAPPPPPPLIPIIIGSSFGALVLLLPAVWLALIWVYDMKRFEHIIKWMKRCGRRHMVELDGHSGRGPVGDQLRAILAKEAFKLTTEKLFKKWDADGEGSVSRKEFRTWWPKIGYEAPAHDINELFDEFDVDGSGEIDFDEFNNAFAQKGELWTELEAMQQKHDENDNLQRLIDEMKKKIERKEKHLAMEQAALNGVLESQEEHKASLAKVEEEIVALTTDLETHQARLDAFKKDIKAIMRQNTVVQIFKSLMTPDEAAVVIQAKIRGNQALKVVAERRGNWSRSQSQAGSRAASQPPSMPASRPTSKQGPREEPTIASDI